MMETLRELDIYGSHLHQKLGVGGFLRFNALKNSENKSDFWTSRSVIIFLFFLLQLFFAANAFAVQVGDRVQATANLSVRTCSDTACSYVDPARPTVPSGSTGTINNGPYYGSGFTWWYISWDNGLTGYSVQDWLEVITLLPAPSLLSPSSGATGVSITPTFSWSAVSGANRYWLMVATSSSAFPTDPNAISCPSCVVTGSTGSNSHTSSSTFPYDGTSATLNDNTLYYWKVQAWNTNGTQGNYSSTLSFTTQGATLLPPPSLSSPSNSATGVSTTPTFSWSSVSGANLGYRILVATSASALTSDPTVSTCSNCVINDTPLDPSYISNAGVLSASTTYYWTVHARSTTTYGTWSSKRSFTTQSVQSLPVNFTLSVTAECSGSSPQNQLSWTPSSGATGYYAVYRCTGSNCTPTLYWENATAIPDTTFNNTSVTAGTTYNYFIRASNSAGYRDSNIVTVTTPTCASPAEITIAPSSINFGNVQVDTCSSSSFAIQHVLNTATATGSVSTNPPYSITSNSSFSTSGGDGVSVDVQFCPSVEGTFSGSASISTSAITNISTVSLSGTGFIPTEGAIQVSATLDGSLWSGAVNYVLSGAQTISGTNVPADFQDRPQGSYTLTYNSGGPAGATLSNITPSSTQTLYGGDSVTFTLNFVSPPAPMISSVSPNPVTGSDSAQPFTINGTGFTALSTVTLRDKRTGEVFTNRQISSNTSIQLVINPTFTTIAATWSVEVLDGSFSSGEYQFQVVAPTVALPTVNWTTPPPTSVTVGQTFQVEWTTTGSPTHVNIHWNPTDPLSSGCCLDPVDTTNSSTILSSTSSPYTLVAPTKHTDGTPITSPTTVKYVVHVESSSGSGNSSVLSVIVNPVTSLPTPTLSSPTNGTTGHFTALTLLWNSVTNGVEYRYQVSKGPTFNTDSTGRICYNCVANDWTQNTTSYYLSGLESDVTYYWRVRAGNYNSGRLTSAWSDTSSFTTQAISIAEPTELIANSISDYILITWRDNSNNEAGFKLERRTGISGNWSVIASIDPNILYYQDYEVTSETTYYYRVYAYDVSANTSGYSNEDDAKIKEIKPAVTWTTPLPNSITSGQTSPLAWNVSGAGNISHTNIHWDTDSVRLQSTNAIGLTLNKCSSVCTEPQGFSDNSFAAPTAGTWYLVAHAIIDGVDYWSPVQVVTVNPSCESPTSIMQLSEGIEVSNCIGSGQKQTYMFDVQSGKTYTITLTPLRGDPDIYLAISATCLDQVPNGNTCYRDTRTSSTQSPESIRKTADSTGIYYVAVYGYGDSEYRLRVDSAKPDAVIDADNNSPQIGDPVKFSGVKSIGSPPTCAIENYTWDFGDNSTVEYGSQVEHSYSSTNGGIPYTVSLTVTDDCGGSDTATMSVAVGEKTSGTNNIQSFSNDPVNLATGNYTYDRTDLAIPGIGIPFEFKRSYNSKDARLRNGPLGYGWRHSYSMSLKDMLGTMVVAFWDGNREAYQDNGDGTFTADSGIYNTLASNGDGTFTLTTKQQLKYNFDGQGRLASIVDKNGNTLAANYDASGNLDSITDTAGRLLV